MKATPLRLLSAAFWPLSIWGSLSHLEEHPADDYVERTTPIVATAIAFLVCAGGLVALMLTRTLHVMTDQETGDIIRIVRGASAMDGVLWFFLPVIYLIGFWLFTSRDEAFPR